ncbi:MAG: molybdenum cofactor sulfurase [Candidatus Nanopelagicales bacterium]
MSRHYPTGSVVATHLWPPGLPTPVRVDTLLLDWGGPVGDRHHGLTTLSDTRQREHYKPDTKIRNHRQVSIVSAEEMTQVAAAMGIPEIGPGLIADNLYVTGVPQLTALPRMTRLVFDGGAVLMLGGENGPCTIAGALIEAVYGTAPPTFPKAALHRRGVTGWVEHPGSIIPGATFEVRTP